VGAYLIADGQVAVGENAGGQLRIFDRSGRWVRTIGRSGAGPGEFEFLRAVFRTGDTLFAFDPMLRRVTAVLASRSDPVLYARTLPARSNRYFMVWGRANDGQWVADYEDSPGWNAPPGVNRARGGVGLIPASGAGEVRWVASLPGTIDILHNPTGNIRQASQGPIAFTPRIYATGSGQYLWYGESSRAELVRYDVRSGARRTVALPIEVRIPSRELIAASRADDDAMDPRGRQSFRDAKFGEYVPRTLPFFEALVPTEDGGLWVQVYAGTRSLGATYLVLDASGSVIASITGPPRFRVTDVRADRVVGLYRDEDGLDEVRVYALIRR
jgi:hypothetical protein